ncbi:RmlC-like cupin [Polychaeton citri CBS 116435]|uniref:RmlC-like cupin n=1 Tax=Polychaeton citri CBS 116435 TaxID=1314669 RepID=A0A9P4UMX5_9PEZI|nr:RmlC-like cupin [Polychaeton citri CBS 116435]
MKWIISTFFAIIAVTVTVFYQQQQQQSKQPALSDYLDYMRSFLRPSAAKNFSRAITSSAKNTSSAMSPSSTFVGLPVIPPSDPSLTSTSPKPRNIRVSFEAIEQAEGAGARVRRSIGTSSLRNFTPFLMLDHFNVGVGAGFPDHPHRGQETITYLLSGAVDHEDFAGHRGTIETGDLQFMTAGKGIVHAEMPHDNGDGSSNVGMQLWVDLPKELKNCEPRYRDLKASEIPVADVDDGKVTVKVISGRSHGVDSVQELAYTPVWLLDITIRPGGKIEQRLPAAWNAFAYTLSGTTIFDTGATTQKVPQYYNTVFEQKGDQVIMSVPADAKEESRIILVAGLPLDQPIVQYGPFVVTETSQIRQAMFDYSTHSNGFERAEGWQSQIGRSMMA